MMFDTTIRSGEAADTREGSLDDSDKARSDDERKLICASASLTTTTRTRYHGPAMSWLALGALLASWHMGARIDRPTELGAHRHPAARGGSPRAENQPWLTRAAQTRPWITRASRRVTSEESTALDGLQPEWPALASVRTVRRWLGSL